MHLRNEGLGGLLADAASVRREPRLDVGGGHHPVPVLVERHEGLFDPALGMVRSFYYFVMFVSLISFNHRCLILIVIVSGLGRRVKG